MNTSQFLPSTSSVPKAIAQVSKTTKAKKHEANKGTANIVRKNRGTKANNMESFKKVFEEKKSKIKENKNELQKKIDDKKEEEAGVQEEKNLESG